MEGVIFIFPLHFQIMADTKGFMHWIAVAMQNTFMFSLSPIQEASSNSSKVKKKPPKLISERGNFRITWFAKWFLASLTCNFLISENEKSCLWSLASCSFIRKVYMAEDSDISQHLPCKEVLLSPTLWFTVHRKELTKTKKTLFIRFPFLIY